MCQNGQDFTFSVKSLSFCEYGIWPLDHILSSEHQITRFMLSNRLLKHPPTCIVVKGKQCYQEALICIMLVWFIKQTRLRILRSFCFLSVWDLKKIIQVGFFSHSSSSFFLTGRVVLDVGRVCSCRYCDDVCPDIKSESKQTLR